MNPELIVIGDLHLKAVQPYLNGLLKLLKYLNENYRNIPILFLGDIYDTSAPHWEKTVEPFQDFLLERGAITYILSGNHDRSDQKGNALKSVAKFPRVKVFFGIETFDIAGINCTAIPYLHGLKKEAYNNLSGKCDYTFSHVYPEKYKFGNEGFDIPIEAIHVYGHIHEQDDYVDTHGNRAVLPGIPQVTREGEQGVQPRIMCIFDRDKFNFIDLPVFCTIESIKYSEEPVSKDNLINVVEAPSVVSVYQRYPTSDGYFIREEGIDILFNSTGENSEESLEVFDDVVALFKPWSEEENVEPAIQTLCINRMIEKTNLAGEAHG